MKLPRDLGGTELAKALSRIGYVVSRQTGSHLRLAHPGPPERHLTIPAHTPLKLGTLAAILADVAAHHGMDRQTLLQKLF